MLLVTSWSVPVYDTDVGVYGIYMHTSLNKDNDIFEK